MLLTLICSFILSLGGSLDTWSFPKFLQYNLSFHRLPTHPYIILLVWTLFRTCNLSGDLIYLCLSLSYVSITFPNEIVDHRRNRSFSAPVLSDLRSLSLPILLLLFPIQVRFSSYCSNYWTKPRVSLIEISNYSINYAIRIGSSRQFPNYLTLTKLNSIACSINAIAIVSSKLWLIFMTSLFIWTYR